MGRVKAWAETFWERGLDVPAPPRAWRWFRATHHTVVTGPGLTLAPGAVIAIAGGLVRVEGREVAAPGIQAAVRAGWFTPVDAPD